jgi:hypothetical protein
MTSTLTPLAQAWADAVKASDADALSLPGPLPHQTPILESDARYKLWRAGRRTGKSRGALLAAVKGHGHDRARKGLLAGGDILWLSPDYPQSAAIWREEIKPRFAGRQGYTVHESHRRVTRDAGGSLELRSAESIDGIRGRRLDGVIVDEGAYLDLEYAWTAVLRPALADRQGWGFFVSTTNAGLDGNSLKRTPSYFNLLAQKIEDGGLSGDWATWHNRTDDNPTIPAAEVKAMREMYPDDSPTVQQELDALLVAGGALAFGVLEWKSFKVERFTEERKLPRYWTFFGAFDWGFNHPFCFGLFAADEDGTVTLLETVHGRKLQPPSIVEAVRGCLESHGLTFRDLAHTVAGHDCWADHKARGENVPTIAEQCWTLGWELSKANISRVAGVQNMRRYFAGHPPRFRLVDTTANRLTFRCLESRVNDPNKPEDVLKQDADTNGFGGDDPYDMTRYGLASRPIDATVPAEPKEYDPNRDPRAVAMDEGRWGDLTHGPMTDLGPGF